MRSRKIRETRARIKLPWVRRLVLQQRTRNEANEESRSSEKHNKGESAEKKESSGEKSGKTKEKRNTQKERNFPLPRGWCGSRGRKLRFGGVVLGIDSFQAPARPGVKFLLHARTSDYAIFVVCRSRMSFRRRKRGQFAPVL